MFPGRRRRSARLRRRVSGESSRPSLDRRIRRRDFRRSARRSRQGPVAEPAHPSRDQHGAFRRRERAVAARRPESHRPRPRAHPAQHRQGRRLGDVRRQPIDAPRAPDVCHERAVAGRHGARAARQRCAALGAEPLLEPHASDRGSRARGSGPCGRHLSRLATDRFQDSGLGERSAAHRRRARGMEGVRRRARRPRHRLHGARHAAGHHAQRPVCDSLRADGRRHRTEERVPRDRSSHSHDGASRCRRTSSADSARLLDGEMGRRSRSS